MARRPRAAPGGLAYHVMNRSSGHLVLFEDAGDYEAFERTLEQARAREGMRVCACALDQKRCQEPLFLTCGFVGGSLRSWADPYEARSGALSITS